MERKTKIIAISNQKGGVGKTTTVVNLAAALSARHRAVLVVDLDPQAHATLGLGLEKTQGVSLYPVLLGEKPIEDVIAPTNWNNLNIIPSEVDLAGAEIEFGAREDRLEMIRDALAPVKESGAFDYIIIDCPPSLGVVMTSALVAADSVLVPIQAEFLAMDGLALITNSIERIRASMNPALDLSGILFTMVNPQARLSQDVIGEVRKHFGDKVYETTIPRNIRVSEAPSRGVPVVFLDPASKGAESYKAFAWEFMAKNPSRYEMPKAAPRAVESAAEAPRGAEPEPAAEGAKPAQGAVESAAEAPRAAEAPVGAKSAAPAPAPRNHARQPNALKPEPAAVEAQPAQGAVESAAEAPRGAEHEPAAVEATPAPMPRNHARQPDALKPEPAAVEATPAQGAVESAAEAPRGAEASGGAKSAAPAPMPRNHARQPDALKPEPETGSAGATPASAPRKPEPATGSAGAKPAPAPRKVAPKAHAKDPRKESPKANEGKSDHTKPPKSRNASANA